MLENNITGLQHIGLPVTDLVQSRTFYMQMGFQVVMSKMLNSNEGITFVAMMKNGDLVLELYQLPEDEKNLISQREDGHFDHIALNVKDIQKAYREIKKTGLEILEEDAPKFLPFWTNGVKFFTVRGPDGEKVEFNQIM